jgi:hypothetical protein
VLHYVLSTLLALFGAQAASLSYREIASLGPMPQNKKHIEGTHSPYDERKEIDVSVYGTSEELSLSLFNNTNSLSFSPMAFSLSHPPKREYTLFPCILDRYRCFAGF